MRATEFDKSFNMSLYVKAQGDLRKLHIRNLGEYLEEDLP